MPLIHRVNHLEVNSVGGMKNTEKNYKAFIKAIAKVEKKYGIYITSNGKIEVDIGNFDFRDMEEDLRKEEDK